MIPPVESLITEDRILSLYERSMAEYGGTKGYPDAGCVERSLGGARQACIYESPEETGEERGMLTLAVRLFYYLIKNHCFVDGNKRVAWASTCDIFCKLGIEVCADDDEVVQFCLDIAASNDADSAIREIYAWFLADGRLVAMK